MAGRRSISPFAHRKQPQPFSSSYSSTSSIIGGARLIPRSSPSSVSSHILRPSTPGRTCLTAAPVPYPASEELPSTDTSRSGESISVTVRFRPLSDREILRADQIAWYADGDKIVRRECCPATAYAFDRVFGPTTTSQVVYDVAARPVVKAAMEGVNGTVFAYGVTSSGKTHTMHGDHKSPGIIPLAIKDVFGIIQDTPGREFLLRVSYLEIYNEVINDLLDPTGQNLRVREDSQGTYVEGMKEEVVLSSGHALSFIAAGEEHRHVGSNNFNLFSSRSHTIFTLMIESSAHGDKYDGVIFSQLNLIDLAGSESSKTETTGLRRREGSYINKSLLTLGTVIGKLSEGKASHIPYRDSKLTRLLQSSLSGHGHVSLICTVTPASSNVEETHNTLKFASRAKRVEIHASRNRIIDEKSLIKKYQREISSLKNELEQLKKGMLAGINNEELMSLKQQLEEGQVKMQSRLEEEEEAKAVLVSRIRKLTKLILVSSKSTIPDRLSDLPGHQHNHSFGEKDDSECSILSNSLEPLSDIKYSRTSCKTNEELLSSSTITESAQDGIVMSDQMDLLVEQVKQLAGEIALGTSALKRLVGHSVDDPEGSKVQIQNVEQEIHEKRKQIRVLEQHIAEIGEATLVSASLVDMQQTVMRLMTQCNEKAFELEIKSADNRILQENLQRMHSENKELQEKLLLLQEQQKHHSTSEDKESLYSSDDKLSEVEIKLQCQVDENEKLKQYRRTLIEESNGLLTQNQQLSKEASYAKELASAAAVELKNLTEEVTKLSLENERQAKKLLAAQEVTYCRADSDGIFIHPEKRIEGIKSGRKITPTSRGSEIAGIVDMESWSLDFNDLRMELQAGQLREAALEVSLADKEVLEEEYKKKLDAAKARELSLENDLADMWILVAKLKKGSFGISEFSADPRFNKRTDVLSDLKENKVEYSEVLKERKGQADTLLKDRLVPNGLTRLTSEHLSQSSDLEPVLSRLKARIQEIKEKKQDSISNGDGNSHVCKVCFESPTSAVLLPCRHFCLCKPCSFACVECPLCRTKISDRIVAFIS